MSYQSRDKIIKLFEDCNDRMCYPTSYIIESEKLISSSDINQSHQKLNLKGSKDNFRRLDSLNLHDQNIQPIFSTCLSTDNPMPSLPVFSINSRHLKYLKFPQESSRIYILIFINLSNPQSKPILSSINILFYQHPTLKKIAKISIIAFDKNPELISNIRNEYSLKNLSFYWAGNESNPPECLSLCGETSIPICFYIHCGLILSAFNPLTKNIIKDLEDYIKNPQFFIGKNLNYLTGSIVSPEVLDINTKHIIKVYEEFIRNHKEISGLEFGVKYQEIYSRDKIWTKIIGKISGELFKKYSELFEFMKNELMAYVFDLEIEVDFEETIQIDRGEKCDLCGKKLKSTRAQYLCLYCIPKHYHCEECEKSQRTGSGSARFAHPHYVYKITKFSSKLDEIRVGPNQLKMNCIYDEDPENCIHLGITCDNSKSDDLCYGSVIGTRYKCAHCLDFDLCEACQSSYEALSPSSESTFLNGHSSSHVVIVMHYP
ncbi:hypothetical protein SteCoe_29737 [Stentor coeruleus]|uniref:ZZ-type domain-containing protein n=1 Tax=Stentor coeruleus TaxID=5963 RepID=A0A1R2B559_9CILI|nr:hypothetical protein SteCoe_29737 [Stentor coeruleus]